MDIDPNDPDGNGITSPDCNSNGVPDECEFTLPVSQLKLAAPDTEAGDYFGWSVCIDTNTAIVGGTLENQGIVDTGAAHVFVKSERGWEHQAKLSADDASEADAFGWSVSISGNTAIIGAALADDGGNDAGSAYVFVRSGSIWTQQAKLAANDGSAEDRFGTSVSINGDTAVVGSRFGSSASGPNTGCAYIFHRSGGIWTQQAKLTADDAADSDEFGISASISGDTVAIGSRYGDSDSAADAGAVYVFERSGTAWALQAKLTAEDAAGSDEFGFSVAVSDDKTIVGAPFDDDSGLDSGSAYIFLRNGGAWTQQAKLATNDAEPNDQFGYSVSVDGDIAIIGAYLDDDDGDASGAAYIFTHDDTAWPQAAKLVANDAAPGDYFGTCVSVSGDSAIVGALFDDDGGIDSGSAYLFSPAGDCNVNAIPDTCEPDHDNDGIINDCDNCPTLRNPSQTDLDADGVGDLCDNCPEVANLDQLDSNNDSIGDVCPCPMRGDMNDDGIVDSNDIQLFVEKLLS